MLMLKAHLDAIEKLLMASYKIAGNSGHSLHKGTPREGFIKDFLLNHVGKQVSIGSGELIDCHSQADQPRNQHDIVLYHSAYPKIHFGNGIDAFLAESVVATIEVKSSLTQVGLKQSITAASKAKELKRNTRQASGSSTGTKPPRTFVVAYEGLASLDTVYNWIKPIHEELDLVYAPLPLNRNDRDQMVSPSIDGVFILETGFLYFANTRLSFLQKNDIQEHPDTRWAYADQSEGALMMLFLLLTEAISNSTGVAFDALPYTADFFASNLHGGS